MQFIVLLYMTKIALFIDGENMFHAQKRMGFFIDYLRLKEYFSKGKTLTNCFYYKGLKNKPMEQKERSFLNYLSFNGFTIIKKDVKTIYDDDTGIPRLKCNLDIEIVIDMFNYANKYGEAILFSGDGDFERAIMLLRTNGKTIRVASCRGMIAQELASAANELIYLEDIQRYIERKKRKPEKEKIEEKKEIKKKSE